MAESAISLMFSQLSVWLKAELKLLGGLGEEVQLITDKMGHMRAFLRVADAEEENDPQVKEWVDQVREIAFDTEDVLETYMLRFDRHYSRGFSGYLKKVYCSVKNLKHEHRVASEIKRIRLRLEKSYASYQEFVNSRPESSSVVANNTWHDGRGNARLLEEAEVVGIEKPKKQLVDWLCCNDYAMKVVSLVGMAGLGKTTLVKKVYDDQTVKVNFDHHVWVSVSESYKVENLLQDIIKQLAEEVKETPPQGLESMKVDGMREFIYNFLQEKKYIIVLDDIWSIDAWEALKYSFPRNITNGRGCIIITTRFNNVGNAARIESNGHVYYLEPLPPQQAKELFDRKAFPSNSCPYYLEEISETILKRCEGLPLAIVLIGGLLAIKEKNIEEWTRFVGSLGSELEGDNLKRMRKLLSLSFYDLPYYLKACFLFLSIFPEDQLLEKATIIRLWIAEGYVEAAKGRTMEDIAEGYLSELFNRSLIQVADTSRDGRPRNFRIHDLVREYIISKAREQNIVSGKSEGEMRWPEKIRHLAIDNYSSINCTEQICGFEHLRSLIIFGSVGSEWRLILEKVLCGACRKLKVLNLSGAPLDSIPAEVFKLYRLKYFSLRNTKVTLIPKSIGNLRKLETLDLKESRVAELPIEILNLQRLQYLLVYSYKFDDQPGYIPSGCVQSFKAPYRIGQLLNLQKLCYINVNEIVEDVKIVREIGKLIELRRLGIVKLRRDDGKELCISLTKLTNLRSLSITSTEEGGEVLDLQYPLSFPFLRTLVLEGYLEKVPPWINSLNALTSLNLRWSRLGDNPLECLQGLPNLLELQMHGAYEGEGLLFKAGGFQKLKELELDKLRGLKWMSIENGSMPCLQRFFMLDCKAIAELPAGMEHLRNLEYVEFTGMSEEFVERLHEERINKIAHVPEVVIGNFVDGKWKRRWLNG